MTKLKGFVILCFLISAFVKGQTGYDIRISLKGCPDTTLYLARYFWDQLPVIDSCKKVKNGKIRFAGDFPLERGVYFLANQARDNFYFQFIVDDQQYISIQADHADVVNSFKTDDIQNDQFFSYIKFITSKTRQQNDFLNSLRGKKDSSALATQKLNGIGEEVSSFEKEFLRRNQGKFVADLIRMKAENYPTEVPLASNNRPDSVYQFLWYRQHYFDHIPFKDERVIYTPFFASKVKNYFSNLVVQHPDSLILAFDDMFARCTPSSQVFNTLVGHYTHEFEQNRTMSFDQTGKCNTFEKVFIHLCEKYIVSGKTDGYYDAGTVSKIKEKTEILKRLLPGETVPDLFMIDTIYGAQVLRMGFDTVRSSAGATFIYNKNAEKLSGMFRKLYDVKAKYTVLVFWAADCGHCLSEIPKLHRELEKLKGKTDVKVYAVQTKEEMFESWKKIISEKELKGFVHVFDPVHLNAMTLKERFDIVATPAIFLLDKNKKIIAKKLAAEQVADIITNLENIEKNLK